MTAGTWRPGHRRRPVSRRATRLEDTVIALATTNDTRLVVKAEPPEVDPKNDPNDPLYDGRAIETGDEIILLMGNIYGGKSIAVYLSQMTTEELDAWKQILNLAYERAREITSERDRVAAEAAHNGDDSYIRRHRASPAVVIRPRKS